MPETAPDVEPDGVPDEVPDRVLPGSTRDCGCYVRLPDYRAVMCDDHAAARDERLAVERQRREERARALAERLPWDGPGGGAFRGALLTGVVTAVGAFLWAGASSDEAAFEAGYETAPAQVGKFIVGSRASSSYYDITFDVHGTTYHARLDDYDPPEPSEGGTVRIDYATADPTIVRTVGYDSADETSTYRWFTLVPGIGTAALAARWGWARTRARRRR